MKTAAMKQLSEDELQKLVGEFVNREVIYCVSPLFNSLANRYKDIYWDFPHLFNGTPIYGDWACHECNHTWEDVPETIICPKCKKTLPSRDDNFDPIHFGPIFEHWIVSDWLADQLEELGEAVEKDCYGLTVWGRSSYGQAILMDRVIREIYQNLKNKRSNTMSQSQWDLLEKSKQDIIDGKLLCETWDFKVFEGMDNTLTEEEMIEVFKRFPNWSDNFYEVGYENLEQIADEVIEKREKTTA